METEKGPALTTDQFRNRIFFGRLAAFSTALGLVRLGMYETVDGAMLLRFMFCILTSIAAQLAIRSAKEGGKDAADATVRALAERSFLILLFVPLFILKREAAQKT